MTMGKKDYQLFADAISQISEEEKMQHIINFLMPIFQADNSRFSEEKFKDWIDRRINNKTMKGTKYNSKYMPLGVV